MKRSVFVLILLIFFFRAETTDSNATTFEVIDVKSFIINIWEVYEWFHDNDNWTKFFVIVDCFNSSGKKSIDVDRILATWVKIKAFPSIDGKNWSKLWQKILKYISSQPPRQQQHNRSDLTLFPWFYLLVISTVIHVSTILNFNLLMVAFSVLVILSMLQYLLLHQLLIMTLQVSIISFETLIWLIHW